MPVAIYCSTGRDSQTTLMNDLIRLLGYGAVAAIAIFVLISLAGTNMLSGNVLVSLAILLVVVLPVALMVVIAKKEKAREDDHKQQG